MQLTRLKLFHTRCLQDLLEEGAIATATFYFHEQLWWDLGTKKSVPASLSQELEKAHRLNSPHRRPKSKDTFFPVSEAAAVVRASFKAAPRKTSQNQFWRVVARSFKDASNAFEVEYNQLTGLLGKKAMLVWLENALKQTTSKVPVGDESTTEVSTTSAVSVIAIDIDFFKQVNDHYGHSYGDLVLKAFAIRLQEVIQSYTHEFPDLLDAVACHASGEEFFCIASGKVESSVFFDLAESIRTAISNQQLPDEDQILLLTAGLSADSITIPPIKARNITCSVGVVIGASTDANIAGIANSLLKQADLALYRAKALGRNKTVEFSTILERCGQVLEQRQDVGLIIIDIGNDVGVKKGQEFHVFHPDFTGTTPFVVDDGRSKRTLGIYPRMSICRITVMEVQGQISFCSQSSTQPVAIPSGANLEAIPLGSIGHLFTGISSTQAIGLAEWMRPEIESKIFFNKKKSEIHEIEVLALRIYNQAELLEKRGADFINRILASASEALRKSCPKTQFAGGVAVTELALVSEDGQSFNTKNITEELDKVSLTFGNLPVFSVGIFKTFEFGEVPKWSPKSYADCLILARYAATYPGKNDGTRIEVFSQATAFRGLAASRAKRQPHQGYADFEQFRALGFILPSILNWGGVFKADLGDFIGALPLFLEASTTAPDNVRLRMNLFGTYFELADFENARKILTFEDKKTLRNDPSRHVDAAIKWTSLLLMDLDEMPTQEKLEEVSQYIQSIKQVGTPKTIASWEGRLVEMQRTLQTRLESAASGSDSS